MPKLFAWLGKAGESSGEPTKADRHAMQMLVKEGPMSIFFGAPATYA